MDETSVPIYHVMLMTVGQPKSEMLEYEADEQPEEGSAIYVDGRWAGIREAIPTNGGGILLDCRRFYRFALVDEDGDPVEPGDYFQEDPSMPEGQRFMPDENNGKVVRVISFEPDADPGYDAVLVVERFND